MSAFNIVYIDRSLVFLQWDDIELARPRSSRPRWIGGACPLAQLGPWLLIEVLRLPNGDLGCAHGLWASAWALVQEFFLSHALQA